MNAEIISIGDELTSGQRLDTNSQWIAQQLVAIGIDVVQLTTVGDDLETNVSAFRDGMRRADLIVCTGGIGPTADDLTRHAIAEVAQVELYFDQKSMDHIRQIFESRGREMPDNNRIQAMFPEGSKVIPNPQGTAPGVDLTLEFDGKSRRIVALPGVPYEMKQMWEDTILPTLVTANQLVTRHFCVHCFGMGESQMVTQLPGIIDRDRSPRVGITASQGTITFRITATEKDEPSCEAMAQPTIDWITSELGEIVFGFQDQTLPDVVIELLQSNANSIAILDCGLAGLPYRWMKESAHSHQTEMSGMSFSNLNGLNSWLDRQDIASLPSRPSDEQVESVARFTAEYFESDCALLILPKPNRSTADRNHLKLGIWLDGSSEIAPIRRFGPDAIHEFMLAKATLNHLRLFLKQLAIAD